MFTIRSPRQGLGPLPSARAMELLGEVAAWPAKASDLNCFRAAETELQGECKTNDLGAGKTE